MSRSTRYRTAMAFTFLLTTAAWASIDDPKTRTNPKQSIYEPTATQTPGGRHPSPTDFALTPIRATDVAQAVRDFIGVEAREHGGLCQITDPVEQTTLDLSLKDVYVQKLMKVRPDTFVTCATFEAADGTAYDVDFYVTGTTRFNLKVVDATIHAKNGLQRYAWANEKGLMQVRALSSEMPMREELAH